MAKLVYKKEISLEYFEHTAEDVAEEIRNKYSKFADINIPLLAVVVADYADDLRRALFNAETE